MEGGSNVPWVLQQKNCNYLHILFTEILGTRFQDMSQFSIYKICNPVTLSNGFLFMAEIFRAHESKINHIYVTFIWVVWLWPSLLHIPYSRGNSWIQRYFNEPIMTLEFLFSCLIFTFRSLSLCMVWFSPWSPSLPECHQQTSILLLKWTCRIFNQIWIVFYRVTMCRVLSVSWN